MAGLTGLSASQSLYNGSANAGSTGEGAAWSQGRPLQPQETTILAHPINVLPGFDKGSMAAPLDFEDGDDWTLPGSVNPNRTPRTHATPFAGWAGSYNDSDAMSLLNENQVTVHSADFGALSRRVYSAKWATAAEPSDIFYSTSIGENNLDPIKGQMRNRGGFDATQGYGGGGSGPGGINSAPTGKGKQTRFTEPQPTYSQGVPQSLFGWS